ncbi:hypothetical protein ACB098_04G060100 [Castanea mollissima]
MWPILAVFRGITRWLQWLLPTNLYNCCDFRVNIARTIMERVVHYKWQGIIEQLISKISCITIICIFDLDDKFLFTWIDDIDSIDASECLEAKLACGIVAVKAKVHGVTTIWSCAQRIGDHVCATRLTVPYS